MKLLHRASLVLPFLAVSASSLSDADWSNCEVLYRDVAIIGGGSTGSYTAVRLRDNNYTVAVVEPKSHLGGNAETYTAPNGWTIDIGVIVFDMIDTVRNYFGRFNVPLIPLTSGGSPTPYVDFSTGKTVTDYQGPSQADAATGFTNYATQLAKYPNLNYGFNLSYPIPSDSDLLMPFGDFVSKYNMSGAVPQTFITNQGYAPLLNITTLYMLKYLNKYELDNFKSGFYTTKNHNIQQLYQSVNTFLGDDSVFLNSTVMGTDRTSSDTVRVLIQTPTGRKQIVAKKLVVTAAPTLSNMQSIFTPLTATETSMFSEFFANGYYTGILTNTSLPGNYSSQAVGPSTSPYRLPTLPGLYSAHANPGAPDHIQVYYGSPTVLPPSQVQADIVASVKRIQSANGWADAEPQWAIFSAHTPFNCMVSNEAIQDRFYEKLYAMQGVNGTFWNGTAWMAQDSSVLWQFTDQYVVPKIVEALEAMG